MQFLRILFWCLLAFIAAVFTLGNWFSVPVRLWGGLIAETNLPFLLLLTFLLGLLPALSYHHVSRWRLRQRLASLERQLAEMRALPITAAPPHAAPVYPMRVSPVPTTAPALDPGDLSPPPPEPA